MELELVNHLDKDFHGLSPNKSLNIQLEPSSKLDELNKSMWVCIEEKYISKTEEEENVVT